VRLDGRQLKRGGFATRALATEALEHVRALVALASDDPYLRARIADLVIERSRRRGALPTVDEVRRRLGAGLDPTAPATTTREWLTEWLATKRAASVGTRDRYAQVVDTYWRPHLGDVPLDRLRRRHATDVLDWIERRNAQVREARRTGTPVPHDPLDPRRVHRVVDVNTQRMLVTVLSIALNAAVDQQLLTRNPLARFKLPHEDYSPRTWSPEQVVRFVGATADHRLGVLYRIVLLRGLRRGEVLGLRWSDVDLDAGALRIPRLRTKTRAGARTVTLGPSDVDALRTHRRRLAAERLAAGAA